MSNTTHCFPWLTDKNCLNTLWTLPTATIRIKLVSYWLLGNLDTLYEVLTLTFNISLCVHSEIFLSLGLLLPFESKREDNSPFESWIKIAKLWWASKYEHWSTEDSNSPRWSPTQTAKECFSQFTQQSVEWNIEAQNRNKGWMKIQDFTVKHIQTMTSCQ